MQGSTSVSALGARHSSGASSSAATKRKTRHWSGAPPATRGLKRAHYREARLPLLLLLPQLLVLLLFFFIPAIRALAQAFVLTDPFGNSVQFVGFDNFRALITSPEYQSSVWITIWFTLAQNAITLVIAMVLAFATDRVVRVRGLYRSVILLPYAIAPVIAYIAQHLSAGSPAAQPAAPVPAAPPAAPANGTAPVAAPAAPAATPGGAPGSRSTRT